MHYSVLLLTMKENRNHAIDLIKFIAAILITNSHMVSLYPGRFSPLATGGAIGDGLFFFCSGFLLMKGSRMDFFNWYKKRINRIYPTVFAIAIINIVAFGSNPSLKHVILNGGGWFVQAILLFYALFWFVKRFLSDRLWIAYSVVALITLVWFIGFWDKDVSIFTFGTYIRWPIYFMIMLSGASMSGCESENGQVSASKIRLIHYLVFLMLLSGLFYGYQVIEARMPLLKSFQVILVPVLMCMIVVLYRICSSQKVLGLYRRVYWPVYYISACCLEIYLSGRWSFGVGERLIELFPLNLMVTFLLIFVVAYLVKVFSNFLSQTFKTERYDWRKMVEL